MENEKRKHQRQQVLLPLRVTAADATGNLLYQGITINVGSGGVYFRTYAWRSLCAGMPVDVVISVPPDMLQELPFGGMTGRASIVRVEESGRFARLGGAESVERPTERGVALRFESKLRFEPDVRMPFETPPEAPEPPSVRV